MAVIVGDLVAGAILVGAGMYGSHVVGRRAFERTNAAGIQEFQSYGSMVRVRSLEGLITSLSMIGKIVGAIFLFLGFFFAGVSGLNVTRLLW